MNGAFALAARAYYQTFICEYTPLRLGVDPRAFEGGVAYREFNAAIETAAHGHFREAAALMRSAKREIPAFTDAGYLAGIFAWAAGNRHAARSDWQATLAGPHFAYPEDGTDPAQIATSAMLKWSRTVPNAPRPENR